MQTSDFDTFDEDFISQMDNFKTFCKELFSQIFVNYNNKCNQLTDLFKFE